MSLGRGTVAAADGLTPVAASCCRVIESYLISTSCHSEAHKVTEDRTPRARFQRCEGEEHFLMSWYSEWWCKGTATRAPPPGPFRSCWLLWRGLSRWLTFANFLPLVRGSLRTVKGWRLWVGVQVNDGACWDEESSHGPRRNNQGSGEKLKEMLEWKWHLCRLSFCNPAMMLVLILDLFHQAYKSSTVRKGVLVRQLAWKVLTPAFRTN